MYHFDETIERRGTRSVKWDGQQGQFGLNELTPFWIADMDFPVADCITDALKNRTDHPVYGYAMPPAQYKQAICDWFMKRHGYEISPEWIIPAQHTVTTLTIVLCALTQPGDKCLLLTPAYDAFFNTVTGTGRSLVCMQMTEEDGYYGLDFNEFEEKLKDGVRCLIFCNPHNPGGKCWTETELEHIASLCEKYDVLILSDDVHCDWAFELYKYTPVSTLEGAAERTVMFTSPSKTFNLAAFCTSNMIIESDSLRKQVQDALNVMFIKGPNQFGYIVTEAAYQGAAEWVDEVKDYVYGNYLYACAYWAENAPVLHPFRLESTFLVWVDCRKVSGHSKEICRELAEGYGISVNNGASYGPGGDGFIRLNLACPRSMLETGVEALARWCVDKIGK